MPTQKNKAGRKPFLKDAKQVVLQLESDMLTIIDRKRKQKTRSAFIRDCLQAFFGRTKKKEQNNDKHED